MTEESNQDSSAEKGYRSSLLKLEFPGNTIKKAAIIAALDIRLTRMRRSPERCARNLMELGLSSFPDKLPKDEQFIVLQKLMYYCKTKDLQMARELFVKSFLS